MESRKNQERHKSRSGFGAFSFQFFSGKIFHFCLVAMMMRSLRNGLHEHIVASSGAKWIYGSSSELLQNRTRHILQCVSSHCLQNSGYVAVVATSLSDATSCGNSFALQTFENELHSSFLHILTTLCSFAYFGKAPHFLGLKEPDMIQRFPFLVHLVHTVWLFLHDTPDFEGDKFQTRQG